MGRGKIRFLADENIAPKVVLALRSRGYDVSDVKELRLSGLTDPKVLQLANRAQRVVLTHDRDFAHALFHPPLHHCGILIVRLSNQTPDPVAERLLAVLQPRILKRLKRSVVLVTDETVLLVH